MRSSSFQSGEGLCTPSFSALSMALVRGGFGVRRAFSQCTATVSAFLGQVGTKGILHPSSVLFGQSEQFLPGEAVQTADEVCKGNGKCSVKHSG